MMVDVLVGDQPAIVVDVPVVGALVRVRVPGTPGGYLWAVSGLQGRVRVFDVNTLRDETADMPPHERPVGGVADREFLFTTWGDGEAYALLTLARPWETDEPLKSVDITFRTANVASTPSPAPAAF